MRPFALLLLAFALVLAPLGICLGGGAAMAAFHDASGMHHRSQVADVHSEHGDRVPGHFCPDCKAPGFVKAGKVGQPDAVPTAPSVTLPTLPNSRSPRAERLVLRRAPSTFHPPPPQANRVRLQI